MSRLSNEDLFEGSKMTFGEHLEELRLALFRSLIGIAIGTVFGFIISNHVIRFVEMPLLEALDDYYLAKTKSDLQKQYGELPKDLTASLDENRRVYEEVFVERTELARLAAIAVGDDDADGDADSSQSTLAIVAGLDADAAISKPVMPKVGDLIATRIWRDAGYTIQATNAQEPFFSWMKVGVITGLTLAAPWVFWQIWIFVAEGLYPQEKQYVHLYLPFSMLLFLAGASLAFFFVFKPVLGFLFSFNAAMNSDPIPRISEWLSFVLLLPLGFGVGFQLPLVMLFLNRIGIFTVESFLSQWRIAILLIFVAAMLLTPADPQSMLLLAMPLTCLYFLGILLCKYLPKREGPFGEGYDPS